MNLSGVSDERLEEIRKNHYDKRMGNCMHIYSVFATDEEIEEMAKELQMYRGLAKMRKDVLESELAVLGGYSEEELENKPEHICKNCKWKRARLECPQYPDTQDEFGCVNDSVTAQVVANCYDADEIGFDPEDDFGCNQWEKK